MWELDYKESQALQNWCFWTVVLEKTLESPLDCQEIQPVHPKGNQFWIFIGRTDIEAETPILWPPDAKNWLIWKDPDAGKDWRWEKGTTEDEMVGWHHWLNGHEFEQAPGVGDGQGGLVCCSPWGRRESDTTERLNWTELVPSTSPLHLLTPTLPIYSLSSFHVALSVPQTYHSSFLSQVQRLFIQALLKGHHHDHTDGWSTYEYWFYHHHYNHLQEFRRVLPKDLLLFLLGFKNMGKRRMSLSAMMYHFYQVVHKSP